MRRCVQRTMKKVFNPITIFLIVLFLFFPATAEVFSQETSPQTVRILVPQSNSALPFLLLAVEDPLPGIDIQANVFINHPQALALLIRGEADLLFTGTSQGWENYLSGGPLVMLNTGTWGISYLIGSANCPQIEDLTDLVGKRLALPFPGSPLDFQTRYLLKKRDIDPDRDVMISYSPLPQTAALLTSGKIDAAPVPEPLASNLVINRGLSRLLDYKKLWAEVSDGDPRSPQVSLFATRSYTQEHKQLLNELIRVWRHTSQEVVENPVRMAGMFAGILGFPEEVVRLSIDNTLFYVPSAEENRSRVEAYYLKVKEFLPGKRGDLQTDFFFSP